MSDPTSSISDAAKIAALLRSAVFLRSSVEVRASESESVGLYSIQAVKEEGVGKYLRIISLELVMQATDVEVAVNSDVHIGQKMCFITRAGDLHLQFTSIILSISAASITIESPVELTLMRLRHSPRRPFSLSAAGWGRIEIANQIVPARIELKDFSSNGLGIELSIPQKNLELVGGLLSGVITSNNLSVRIIDAEILHVTGKEPSKYSSWTTYLVGCQLQPMPEVSGRSEYALGDDSRSSKRFKQGECIRIESGLVVGRQYKATIEDISISGLLCRLQFSEESFAFPVGCSVVLPELAVEGSVVSSQGELLRISLDLVDSAAFQSWFVRFTEALHPSMDTWIDVFDQAAMSFATSGGTTSEFLSAVSKTQKFIEHDLSVLKRNPHWIQTWVEKRESGEVVGHISCIRYGDNLWYAGDLWGSQITPIHKEFAKRFLESFVSYALASAPYPKTLGIWKPDHPYWRKMSEAIKGDFKHYIYEEGYCYKIPILDRLTFEVDKVPSLQKISHREQNRITEVSAQLSEVGCDYFAKLMGFDPDSFGSPRLHSAIRASGYPFERLFAELTLKGVNFLAVFSRYPPGTSLQHHQESVWLFPYAYKALAMPQVEEAIQLSASFALSLGIHPAYVKIATTADIDDLPKPMKLVISDPKMWSLA